MNGYEIGFLVNNRTKKDIDGKINFKIVVTFTTRRLATNLELINTVISKAWQIIDDLERVKRTIKVDDKNKIFASFDHFLKIYKVDI